MRCLSPSRAARPLASGARAGAARRTRLGPRVAPADFVILEGVSASREAFHPFLTYSIWVEAPADVRLRRGLERDGEGARAQWEKWMAQEDRYVERERPRERADLVVRR